MTTLEELDRRVTALERAQDHLATKTDIAELKVELLGTETRLRGEMGRHYWGVFYMLGAQAIAIVALVVSILQALKP